MFKTVTLSPTVSQFIIIIVPLMTKKTLSSHINPASVLLMNVDQHGAL